MDTLNFKKLSQRYKSELLDNVIPFWQKNCIDKEFGGYFTNLDRDGSVYDTTKYMWMQWRIVYVFAELYTNPKYSKDEFLTIAKDGFEFLYNNGRDENGQYYFALNQQGEGAIAPYNVYSECFAVMGSAMLYKATHDERYKVAAIEAMNSYTQRINSGNSAGQWNKVLSGKKQYLTLGNYMMLANLSLIMNDCLGSNDYNDHLINVFDIVLNKFYNKEFDVVFENITIDGDFDLDSCVGRMLNPGHVLEAMWFLLNALESIGRNQELEEKIHHIIKTTLKKGWDKEYGGIFYFMDVLGKPHLELQHDMKLWWVHNEALIATLFAYKSSGDKEFLEWFEKIDEYTWRHFPDPEYGEWFAYLNRRGEVNNFLKGGKWKTFFHLPRCLIVCEQLLSEFNQENKEKK